jgi:hypothetical protein
MRRVNKQSEAQRLRLILSAVTCLVLSAGLFIGVDMMEPPPPPGAAISSTATLLVVERDGCGWCDRFREDLAPAYRRSEQQLRAPLHYIDAGDLDSTKRYQLKKPVNGTPTLVMIDTYGREVARYPGHPGTTENLVDQVNSMLRRVK